jgi:hypothetical protein
VTAAEPFGTVDYSDEEIAFIESIPIVERKPMPPWRPGEDMWPRPADAEQRCPWDQTAPPCAADFCDCGAAATGEDRP